MTPDRLLEILRLARPLVASAPAGFRPQLNRDMVLALIDAALSSANDNIAPPQQDSQTCSK